MAPKLVALPKRFVQPLCDHVESETGLKHVELSHRLNTRQFCNRTAAFNAMNSLDEQPDLCRTRHRVPHECSGHVSHEQDVRGPIFSGRADGKSVYLPLVLACAGGVTTLSLRCWTDGLLCLVDESMFF